jgi:hypothetical protein
MTEKFVRRKHEKKLPSNSFTIYNSKYCNPFKEKCCISVIFLQYIKEEDEHLIGVPLNQKECLYLYKKYILPKFTEKDKGFLRSYKYLITHKQESEVDLLLQWLS